jgi:hypothetical protein
MVEVGVWVMVGVLVIVDVGVSVIVGVSVMVAVGVGVGGTEYEMYSLHFSVVEVRAAGAIVEG